MLNVELDRRSALRRAAAAAIVTLGSLAVISATQAPPTPPANAQPGEAVLFQQGCHSLRCLAPTRLLEVKQGPYVSPELDKYLLKVVDPDGDRRR